MMLFAEIDATGWVMIIGAVVLGVIQILTTWANISTVRNSKKVIEDKIDDNTQVTHQVVKEIKTDTLKTATFVAEKVIEATAVVAQAHNEELQTIKQALNGSLESRFNVFADKVQANTVRIDNLYQWTETVDGKLDRIQVFLEEGASVKGVAVAMERIDRHARNNEEHFRQLRDDLKRLTPTHVRDIKGEAS